MVINMKKQLIIGVLLALVLVVSGCVDTDGGSTVEAIREGDYVLVNYTGRLEDGTVFDTSVEDVAIEAGMHDPGRAYQPIGFSVGAGQMIKGFDRGVVGMVAGEAKTLTLSPEDAYGSPSDDRVRTVPIDELSAAGITPVIGKKLSTSYGQGLITDLTNTSVTVDFNHELAGKTLIFDVQIVSIDRGDAAATTADTVNKTKPGGENRITVIETSMGTITAELYETRAPVTTANFIGLAERGFYDGLIFHRVINDFMIQGGCPDGTGMGGSGTNIKLEIHPELTHVDGALAMARSSQPDSASSQFYICDGAQPNLDGQYAVFGVVIDGMDVVRAISEVETGSQNKPAEDVVITKISIEMTE